MTLRLSVFLAATAVLPAQSRVVPSDRAGVEGFTTHQYPFSYSEVRFQQIWNGDDVAANVALLAGVEFRRDGSNATAHNPRAWSYVVTAYETVVSPVSMTTTWANNRGGSAGTVVHTGPLSVPAGNPAYPTPQAWSLALPFSAPFTFTRNNGHFMLEIEGNDPANLFDQWPVDAENQWRTARGDSTRVSAPGCTGTNGERVSLGLSSAATLVLGGTMTVNMTNTSLAAFANWLGFDNRTWLGVPLPVDLGFLGASGCSLGTDLAVQQIGGGPFTWPIPPVPSLEGEVVFTQALGLAANANAGGFVTSDVFQVRLGGTTAAPGTFQSVYRRSDLGLPTGFMSAASFHGAIVRFLGTFN
jgi:hypothetical protein